MKIRSRQMSIGRAGSPAYSALGMPSAPAANSAAAARAAARPSPAPAPPPARSPAALARLTAGTSQYLAAAAHSDCPGPVSTSRSASAAPPPSASYTRSFASSWAHSASTTSLAEVSTRPVTAEISRRCGPAKTNCVSSARSCADRPAKAAAVLSGPARISLQRAASLVAWASVRQPAQARPAISPRPQPTAAPARTPSRSSQPRAGQASNCDSGAGGAPPAVPPLAAPPGSGPGWRCHGGGRPRRCCAVGPRRRRRPVGPRCRRLAGPRCRPAGPRCCRARPLSCWPGIRPRSLRARRQLPGRAGRPGPGRGTAAAGQ